MIISEIIALFQGLSLSQISRRSFLILNIQKVFPYLKYLEGFSFFLSLSSVANLPLIYDNFICVCDKIILYTFIIFKCMCIVWSIIEVLQYRIRIDQSSLFKSLSTQNYISKMQGDTYKKVHIQTLEYREPQNYHHGQEFTGQSVWSEWGRKPLLTYEETCKATDRAAFENGFFTAFLEAYNNHADVKISPDDVWIVIMLHFSKYVNDHSEQLRHAFVSHAGQKKLVVVTSNELLESQWDEFFTLMIAAIRKNTSEGVTEKLESSFTTTGRVEKLLSIATVMNTYQKYFSYGRMIPLCGIQNVHFAGTLEDWKSLKLKLEHLREYDVDGNLKDYVGKVGCIVDKFIDTYQENVDLDFWNKIVNSERGRMGSGSTTKYSGWLIHFFGLEGPVEEVKLDSLGFDIEIDNRITGIKKTVRLVGGMRAVSREGPIYRPHLSFAIRDADKHPPASSPFDFE